MEEHREDRGIPSSELEVEVQVEVEEDEDSHAHQEHEDLEQEEEHNMEEEEEEQEEQGVQVDLSEGSSLEEPQEPVRLPRGGRDGPMPRHVQRALWRILVGDANRDFGPDPTTHEELLERLKRTRVLIDPDVIVAMTLVKRGDFVPQEQQDEAYLDHPLSIPQLGFNISAPHIHATCLEKLKLCPGHKFLDVGSGCGLMTALGAYLVGEEGCCVGFDINNAAIALARENVQKLSEQNEQFALNACTIQFEKQNVFLPDPKGRRFDRINVAGTCPTERVVSLLSLLEEDGKLIVPCGSELQLYTCVSDGSYEMDIVSHVRFGDLNVPTDAAIVRRSLQLERSNNLDTILKLSKSRLEQQEVTISNDDPTDCVLVGKGFNIQTHKAFLSEACSLFSAQFNSGMKDASSNEFLIPEDFQKETVQTFVDFLHKNNPNIHCDNAVELLHLATYLDCPRLCKECEEVLQKDVNNENAAYLFALSDEIGLSYLQEVVLDHIVYNYESVSSSPSYKKLDGKLLARIAEGACKVLHNVLHLLDKQSVVINVHRK